VPDRFAVDAVAIREWELDLKGERVAFEGRGELAFSAFLTRVPRGYEFSVVLEVLCAVRSIENVRDHSDLRRVANHHGILLLPLPLATCGSPDRTKSHVRPRTIIN